jgi:uncharacterized membrane protein YccC
MSGKLQSGFAPLAILGILALVGVGAVGTAAASDSARPGDALYEIDTAIENIHLAFAGSPEAQAEIQNELALERLEEAQSLEGITARNANMQEALTRAQEHLSEAQAKAEEAQENGKDVDEILAILAENHLRQQEVLQGVYEKVPEQAKASIQRAIEQSQKGYKTAVMAVSEGKREELIQGTRVRLENARNMAEEQGIDLPDIDIPEMGKDEAENENGEPPIEVPTLRP